MQDFLGQAAEKKKLAKFAIQEKRYDDAWKFLHEQKELYLRHASRSGFDLNSTRVIEASIHEDLAKILRLESKHKQALINLSYTYKAQFTANRPIATLEKKLKSYFSKVYEKERYEKFKSLLNSLKDSDYISIRDFIEIYFPQLPNSLDE
ncbi:MULTISPECIES: hypothetical protein [Acinetobacter]|uniref:hypothetical protein n=1 Tax=Acinetobacter TaxID=469 RepID=UPI0018AC4328|nr:MULTISPECIES: hypothetical protein [unclassified Acinetobacter]